MNAQDILDAKKESDEKQKNEPSFLGKLFSKSQDGNSQRDHGGHEQTNHDAFRRTFRHDEAALREGAPNQEPSSNEKFIDISTGNDEHNNEEIHDEDINGEAGEEEGLDFNNIDGEPAVRYVRLLESIEEDDFMAVMEIVEEDPTVLQIEDDNHWTALHEAIRAGNIEIVKYILSRGADPFKRVRGGGDAMEVARFSLPQGHEMFRVLKEHMQSKPQRV